jgi:hypothetical protein
MRHDKVRQRMLTLGRRDFKDLGSIDMAARAKFQEDLNGSPNISSRYSGYHPTNKRVMLVNGPHYAR